VSEVYEGMKPYSQYFVRALVDDDIDKLLEIRIRRISKYDIKKNRKQLNEVQAAIDEVNAKLASLTQTTIGFLKDLITKYRDTYPRRTEIQSFDSIEKKDVARQNIRVGYDASTGFFGSEIKESDYIITMSEYDRVLFICKDGSYRIVGPEEKILIPGKVIYWEPFDAEVGSKFTVVYRDSNRIAWAKKVHIHKFIKDREYELIKDKAGKIDLLLPGDATNVIKVHFAPAKRQRVKEAEFDLSELEFIGPSSRGRRVNPKPINRIQKLRAENDPGEEPDDRHTTESSGATVPTADKPKVGPSDDDDEESGGQRRLF
jgi:topoisomerase IV subunit A